MHLPKNGRILDFGLDEIESGKYLLPDVVYSVSKAPDHDKLNRAFDILFEETLLRGLFDI